MVDIPASTSTSATITVGGTVTGSLEVVGDHDWFKITLAAGQSVTITLNGTTLEDPYLRIRNSSGTVIHENDDISSGINRDSRVSFTASTSGTYYIDVGAWDEGYAGQYQLSVTNYVAPPIWTYDQIADQLTSGYWGGDTHRFNVSPGGQLTVNLTALTAAGRDLALAALATWTDIIGVTFVQVTSGGQITFDDNEEGAFAESTYSGSFITSSHVNVETAWIADYGTGLNTYSFQTYIHEIGHALGLGHAGNYNGDGSYQSDALFRNDSWATTVMSYFSQTENSYFAELGFDRNFVTTPMIADIVAMQDLYGLSTTTRSGNTVYGPGWSTSMGALCLFDSGGVDTIDVSSIGGTNRIDLNPGTFSDILGEVGNVSIALGVIIENATGGSGEDVIVGNGVSNVLIGNGGKDVLDGRAGTDQMYGGLGDDNYFVDHANDLAIEVTGQGADTVFATVNYALSAGTSIEILRTSNTAGTAEINLTGNELGQTITGNAGINVVSGGGGNDTLYGQAGGDKLYGGIGNDTLDGGTTADRMFGGAGNDKYRVDNSGDKVYEIAGEGSDTVYASVSYALRAGVAVEGLRTANESATTSINLTGNEFAQTIVGNAGANILNGGAGNDTLIGRAGEDMFVFSNLGGTDRISDFMSGIDTIDLRSIDANTGIAGDQAFNFIGGNAFGSAAGQLRTYESNGAHYVAGDVNGDGVADFIINLGSPTVQSSDFLL
jgi:serralysin